MNSSDSVNSILGKRQTAAFVTALFLAQISFPTLKMTAASVFILAAVYYADNRLHPQKALKRFLLHFILICAAAGCAYAVSLSEGEQCPFPLLFPSVIAIACLPLFSVNDSGNPWFYGLLQLAFIICADFLTELGQYHYVSQSNCRYDFIYQIMFIFCVMVLYSLFMLLGILLSNRSALLLLINVIMLAGLVNSLVLEFTGLPLIANDIKLFSTVLSVASNYRPSLPLILRTAAYGAAVFVINYLCLSFCPAEKSRLIDRLLHGALAIAVLAILLPHYAEYMTITTFFKGNVKTGFVNNFISSMQPVLKEPENWDPDSTVFYEGSAEFTDKAAVKPDVIVIMNEAFSDLSVHGDLKTDIPVIPEFERICGETASGTLVSSVLGRYTCTSEFEFLSGMPSVLSCHGSDIYSMYVNDSIPTICKVMKDLGYNIKGIHPYHRIGYSRSQAWPVLGLEDSIFIDDLNIDEYETLRDFVSDRSCYGMIEQITEEADGPLFLFCITMQNHGGYTDGISGVEPVASELSDDEEYRNYLTLIRQSDIALAELIDYYSSSDRPTVILFFGDHQPLLNNFYDTLYGEAEDADTILKKHRVPYFLWNNYGADFSLPEEMISYNYLSGVLLEQLGISDPWFDHINSLRDDYPLLSYNLVMDRSGIVDNESLLMLIEDPDNPLGSFRRTIYGLLTGQSSRRSSDQTSAP